ncbi:MAG TPA: transcriptional regulator [Verrucomicrobia bacterium]|nr:transcriptional regulator [Verrucomicrobiota bacterium]
MKKNVLVFPRMARRFNALGERLKLARRRRHLTAVLLSERAGVSRATLYKIEKGDPSVAMGYYAAVLDVLGLESELDLLAKDDELGRRLQDAKLLARDVRREGVA